MLNQSDTEVTPVFEKLSALGMSVSFLVPTVTGMEKGIMDAVAPLRVQLKDAGLHDFTEQRQGPNYKKIVPGYLIDDDGIRETKVSLYRPETKGGDPRIWIYGLKSYAKACNLLALSCTDECIFILNASRPELMVQLDDPSSHARQALSQASSKLSQVADELLGKLRDINRRGFIKSLVNADTGVGRTLEHLLGVPINSSKAPDYKGIELKSHRSSGDNRVNLFAQVSNWELSNLKSSAEILGHYGYMRDGLMRLNCTVSSGKPNSQGLLFDVDIDGDLLREIQTSPRIDVAVWKIEKLRERLLEKHRETFWISTDEEIRGGDSYFWYRKIEHTRQPLVGNLGMLLDIGIVTMDHLIKRNDKGRVSERGPLFKIHPGSLGMLFPPSKTYIFDEAA